MICKSDDERHSCALWYLKAALIASVAISIWYCGAFYLIPGLKPTTLPADTFMAIFISVIYSILVFVFWQVPGFLIAFTAIEGWKVRSVPITVNQAVYAALVVTLIAWFVFKVDTFNGLATTAYFVAITINIGIPAFLSWPNGLLAARA